MSDVISCLPRNLALNLVSFLGQARKVFAITLDTLQKISKSDQAAF